MERAVLKDSIMVHIVAPLDIKPFPDREIGIVEQMITPSQAGRVHCHATSWPARLCPGCPSVVLRPNDSVIVVGRTGITLLVKPLTNEAEHWALL
ncbi:MAG: NfeD family protein [Cyanobacteria bacterium J06626_14]